VTEMALCSSVFSQENFIKARPFEIGSKIEVFL